MELDVLTYTEAFDRLLLQLMQPEDFMTTDYQPMLVEVCDLLRIGKVEIMFYENRRFEEMGQGDCKVLYQDSSVDDSRCYQKREMIGNGGIANYRIYQRMDEEAWSPLENEKVRVLTEVLFALNGRTRLLKLAEQSTFYDMELHIPNMNFCMRQERILWEKGELPKYGVCFFNLRRFSVVNKQLGREAATRVMTEFMNQLQQKLGDNNYVCRVGGDNFIILFKKENLDVVVKYLQGTPIVYDKESGDSIIIAASAGYYLVSENVLKLDDVIERAHIAAQSAKKNVGASYVFYNEELQSRKDYVNKVEGMFRKSLQQEEFMVYYQPKVLLKDYSLVGAEALCRWKHDGRLIPPNDFIPILEQSNNICDLDFYVLEHVCRDIRRWIDSNRRVVCVSVNLSRRHMGDMKLLEKILAIVDKYDIPHGYLEIELTETTTDIEFNDLKQIVRGLHEQGIRTAVDDFGMGYSSLNLLRQVPWDVIKIDKSFLPADMKSDPTSYTMISHLFSMLQDMRLNCIVEGVETVDQVKILKENNCYLAQGFYFDKSLPVSEFEMRLETAD